MKSNKAIYLSFGLIAFVVTFITYSLTVQPSVPFWDCGEFTAAATWQQVCHPPGAPLFLMAGRVFQVILPFGDLGWRVNMMSVTATAFAVLFLYLIIVMTIKNYRKEGIKTISDALMVYGSALVGALAFCFCDTIWFNGVESEVYASSTLFTTIVVYLMMRWNEKADEPGHERYLVFIAYMIGLSMGVHLLAVLTTFSIVMLVYFRKYKITFWSFIIMGGIALIAFFFMYKIVLMWIPTLLAGDSFWKNEAKERLIENSPAMTLFALAIIASAGVGLWYGIQKKNEILKLVCASFLLMILGFTTYTQVLVRSNANPPMNENNPKDMKGLVSYLGREQYGDAGNWPRRTDFNDEQKINSYNKKDAKGEYVYGEWNAPEYKKVDRKDGQQTQVPDWTNLNISGELSYMWNFQMNHMFWRYFGWNFIGRDSDIQDAGVAWFSKTDADLINYKSGYSDQFPVRFFAIPFLFGLFGLWYHFKKDPKMGLVFLVMFLLTGVLAAIAQNQQDPQPRERDYFYAGAFMVWCLWISTGTYALIEMLVKDKKSFLAPGAVLAISLLIVPVNMGVNGWNTHSRANNWIPFDYSYNILQSCAKDAILFTNGDNDTFPLWYLQDVEGVRRDVRVVNLSLGQTLWYVDQLKNREPWGAKKIPLSFTDASLHASEDSEGALSYDFGEAQNVVIPVSKKIMSQFTNDTALINEGKMKFTYVGKKMQEREGKMIYLFYVSHKLVLDIMKQTKFERPVYFSSTVGPDVFVGLGRHLRYEGMVLRVCPVPSNSMKTGAMEPSIMEKCFMNIDNSDNYFTDQHYGFKFRYLDGKKYVWYDEVHRRLMQNYRQLYMQYSGYLLETFKDKAKAVAVLDTLNKYISDVRFPMYHDEQSQMATIYKEAGAMDKAKRWAKETIKTCNEIFAKKELRRDRVDRMIDEIKGRHGTYKSAAESYLILGDYTDARNTLLTLYDICKQAVGEIQGSQAYQSELQAVQKNMYDVLGMVVNIDQQELTALVKDGKKAEALEKAKSLKQKYTDSKDNLMMQLNMYIDQEVNKIEGKVAANPLDSTKNQ